MDDLINFALNSDDKTICNLSRQQLLNRQTSTSNSKSKFFSPELSDKISKSKILVVGAGGVGCELLKTLVSTGFRNIEVVDLDTIEISNLNRQFLFRRAHVGLSKAKVACESVKQFCLDDSINLIPHHNNIKNHELFGPDFFKKFDVVLNALDNVSARRHVNRLCLAVDLPLIESGTEGYFGQVYAIRKGLFECFECIRKPAPTTYAVCTIRDMPEKPVHCIAQAKLMFNVLFGPNDDNNILQDLKVCRQDFDDKQIYAQRLFHQLFEVLVSGKLDKNAKTDDEEDQEMESESLENNNENTNQFKQKRSIKILKIEDYCSNDENIDHNSAIDQQKILNIEENVKEFIKSVEEIYDSSLFGNFIFDKDNDLAMRFVSSAANLRMINFGIEPRLSFFDAKGVAGNIIDAIATTNAICAGLIVLDCIKILSGNLNKCRRSQIKEKYIYPENLSSPNPNCQVCGAVQLDLIVDVRSFTVRELFELVLKKNLGFQCPVVDVQYGAVTNFITEDLDEQNGNREWRDDLFSKNLSHEAVKIGHASMLTVDDQSQSLTVNILVLDSPGTAKYTKYVRNENKNSNSSDKNNQNENFILRSRYERNENNENNNSCSNGISFTKTKMNRKMPAESVWNEVSSPKLESDICDLSDDSIQSINLDEEKFDQAKNFVNECSENGKEEMNLLQSILKRNYKASDILKSGVNEIDQDSSVKIQKI